MRIGKSGVGIVLFLTVFVLVVFAGGSVGAASAEKITDAKGYLAKVSMTMAGLKNYHMAMTLDMDTPLGNANVKNSTDLLLSPNALYKSVSDMTILSPKNEQTKLSITQYIQQNGDQFTMYTNDAGKWEKETMTMDGTKAADSLYDLTSYMELVKSVEIKEQTDSDIALAVTFDGKSIADRGMRDVKFKDAKEADIVNTMLRSIGDVPCLIYVNKRTDYVTRIYMDLSGNLQNTVKEVLIGAQASGQQGAVNLMIKQIRMIAEANISNYNQVEKFEIPEEALKSTAEKPALHAKASAIGVIGSADENKIK